MHIYREGVLPSGTLQCIDDLTQRVLKLRLSLDTTRDLLVDCGVFEAALVDSFCPTMDRWNLPIQLGRKLMGFVADGFLDQLQPGGASQDHFIPHVLATLEDLRSRNLPSTIQLRTPEGFSYYGLFPEQYATSARRAVRELSVHHIAVVGLRSIGATLSSIVEREVARYRVPVVSYTVRPRGPPFERHLELDDSLVVELARVAAMDTHFFIVDEGPGLSGSSFASVVRHLAELGVKASRIVLFPSFVSDGSSLLSETARAVWKTHSRYVDDFDRAWIAGSKQHEQLVDLSAGSWRNVAALTPHRITPCQPQHERRKFLRLDSAGSPVSILRFAGFGSNGLRVRERAELLGDSAMTPPVLGFGGGMLALSFIVGRPLQRKDADRDHLRCMLDYVRWRADRIRIYKQPDMSSLLEMACHNAETSLGASASAAIRKLAHQLPQPRALTIVDGRVAPNEWLHTNAGLKKLDAFDHGDDHFFPGPCDVAWDLAGIGTEFGLDRSQLANLCSLYAATSGDRSIEQRILFYVAAYRAYRIGYCHWATLALTDPAERHRFGRRERWYRLQLMRQLQP
jgi:hypothetical protein